MATTTYEPIQSQTLSNAQATVTFTSIPQDYTDLVLVASRQFSNVGTGAQNTLITFNNDSNANYSTTYLINGVSSSRINNANSLYTSGGGNETAQRYSADVWNFFNYSNTNIYKTSLLDFNFGTSMKQLWTGVWRSTAAITRIDITGSGSATFAAGSTFTLYGIANAAVATGVKATGGVITYDDTYYYHTFGASGTFTPKQSLTADILVVAGGGSGGAQSTGGGNGGGGGAGGFLTFTSQSLTTTGYTVTVGAGGALPSNNAQGNDGSNSQFGSLTVAVGGGGGGTYGDSNDPDQQGRSGGSGGGVGQAHGGSYTGGAGTSGQGNAGGNSYGGGDYAGGGGGGAGAAGGNSGPSYAAGVGGVGLSTAISGGATTGAGQLVSGSYYFAGGGGGGPDGNGGSGGGGKGASTATGGNGVTNTGGGGGGGEYSVTSKLAGTGGSGIVIVRYAKA